MIHCHSKFGEAESNVIQQIHQPVIEQELSQNNIALYFTPVKLQATHEHIYWDQASLLAQIGLLNTKNLPVTGIEHTRRLLEISQKTAPSFTVVQKYLSKISVTYQFLQLGIMPYQHLC
jgi:hypothetical protein